MEKWSERWNINNTDDINTRSFFFNTRFQQVFYQNKFAAKSQLSSPFSEWRTQVTVNFTFQIVALLRVQFDQVMQKMAFRRMKSENAHTWHRWKNNTYIDAVISNRMQKKPRNIRRERMRKTLTTEKRYKIMLNTS